MVDRSINENKELVNNTLQQEYTKESNKNARQSIREEVIRTYAIYPFIKIEDNLVRYYPEGRALGQITGFVDNQ